MSATLRSRSFNGSYPSTSISSTINPVTNEVFVHSSSTLLKLPLPFVEGSTVGEILPAPAEGFLSIVGNFPTQQISVCRDTGEVFYHARNSSLAESRVVRIGADGVEQAFGVISGESVQTVSVGSYNGAETPIVVTPENKLYPLCLVVSDGSGVTETLATSALPYHSGDNGAMQALHLGLSGGVNSWLLLYMSGTTAELKTFEVTHDSGGFAIGAVSTTSLDTLFETSGVTWQFPRALVVRKDLTQRLYSVESTALVSGSRRAVVALFDIDTGTKIWASMGNDVESSSAVTVAPEVSEDFGNYYMKFQRIWTRSWELFSVVDGTTLLNPPGISRANGIGWQFKDSMLFYTGLVSRVPDWGSLLSDPKSLDTTFRANSPYQLDFLPNVRLDYTALEDLSPTSWGYQVSAQALAERGTPVLTPSGGEALPTSGPIPSTLTLTVTNYTFFVASLTFQQEVAGLGTFNTTYSDSFRFEALAPFTGPIGPQSPPVFESRIEGSKALQLWGGPVTRVVNENLGLIQDLITKLADNVPEKLVAIAPRQIQPLRLTINLNGYKLLNLKPYDPTNTEEIVTHVTPV